MTLLVSYTFLNILFDLFLSQHVNFPTRFRKSQTASLLDLVITNVENIITKIFPVDPLGKDDYVAIEFNFLRNQVSLSLVILVIFMIKVITTL